MEKKMRKVIYRKKSNSMKKNKLWITGLSLILFSGQIFATIYKWQDANGQIHYDQVPPDNAKAIVIKPDAKPSSSAPNESANAQKLMQELQKQEEKAAEDQKKAEQDAREENTRAINCQRAKSHLADLELKVRVRLQDASGDVPQLTPAQREEEINKTKDAVDRFCTPSKSNSP